MAFFKPSIYAKPSSLREASSFLVQHREKAKIIAGGTLIHEVAQRGLLSELEVLVDLQKIGLSYVRELKGTLSIGAMTTFTELGRSPKLGSPALGALRDVLTAIRPLQVRNVATIGGSICSGLSLFDMPVALLALGAEVSIFGLERCRKTPLQSFLLGYFNVDLKDGEFVKDVLVPVKRGLVSSAFEKFALTADDWALLNCAVSITLDSRKRCKEARITFGAGTGEVPVVLEQVEDMIEGKTLSKAVLKEASVEAMKKLDTTNDARASAEYRRKLAPVLLTRALHKALKRI